MASQSTSSKEREHSEYLNLLARVAHLYYEQGFNQREIAQQIERHPSTISRLLEEARNEGIVRITVHYPWQSDMQLAEQLQSKFQLKAARVLLSNDLSYSQMIDGLGILAARLLISCLRDEYIVGISWGSAVYSTIQAIHVAGPISITAVQMCGAAGGSLIGGVELPRLVAEKLGGTYRYLPAPIVVKDAGLTQSLLNEPPVLETLSLASRADVALVGIGATDPRISQWLRAGYADSFEVLDLVNAGYVGDVCGRFFTEEGRLLSEDAERDLDARLIAVTPASLRKIDRVIGVAGGDVKVRAIRGALSAGLINVLVTDSAAAVRLLSD
ncbi:MAG: helix-turn-helix domain-containing protein [Caldilineaceae bacterium]|nr:helix-turn-helix domain-containing protein [Caldilineaceae bacterium]